MKHSYHVQTRKSPCIIAIFAAAILSGCDTSPSMLNPHSRDAASTANYAWVLFGIAAVVFIGVTGVMVVAILRNRTADDEILPAPHPDEERRTFRLILLFGAVIPALVLTLMIGLSILLGQEQPVFRAPLAENTLTVQVIAHQWWWEVRYPQHEVITANEVHIPVGQRVRVYLTSNDVIHSFWIPELHGKLDMLPGTTNILELQADEAGQYRGLCSEYCGLQHANMNFWVVAQEPAEFEEWVAHQQQPAPFPADDELALKGYQAFMGSACVYCHRIAGTHATGVIGPDLTHFASRLSIGAGILENNHGNLGGWIINSQTIKPGNKMPPMYVDADQLTALLAYLETLD